MSQAENLSPPENISPSNTAEAPGVKVESVPEVSEVVSQIAPESASGKAPTKKKAGVLAQKSKKKRVMRQKAKKIKIPAVKVQKKQISQAIEGQIKVLKKKARWMQWGFGFSAEVFERITEKIRSLLKILQELPRATKERVTELYQRFVLRATVA